MNPDSSPATPVFISTDPEAIGGPAIPVYGYATTPTDGRPVLGAPALRVKVLQASDLLVNGGKYVLQGQVLAMPVVTAGAGDPVQGNVAIPVYPVNAWPTPIPPVLNWWEVGGGLAAIQVLQAIGAATFNASLLDLSGNAHNGGQSVNVPLPSWNATDGWVYVDATTRAILTGMKPAPDWTFIGRFSDFIVGSYLIGTNNPFYLINPDIDGTNVRANWGSNFDTFPPNIASGVIAIAGRTVYVNGLPVSSLDPATDTTTYQASIGSLNFNDDDNPVGSCVGKIQGIAFYPGTLTDAQVLAKSLALAAVTP